MYWCICACGCYGSTEASSTVVLSAPKFSNWCSAEPGGSWVASIESTTGRLPPFSAAVCALEEFR